MRPIMLLLVLLAACSKDSSGPGSTNGHDPTVLITNNGRVGIDTIFFMWRDGQGIAGADTVPPGTQRCARFVAQADSAYFEATISGSTAHYTQPWFDPSARSAWTMEVASAWGYQILVTDVSPTEPC